MADPLVTLLPPHGAAERHAYPRDLRGWQRLLGGYLEPLTLSDGRVLLIDEDGIAKDLPVNFPASSLAGTQVVGPAILIEGDALTLWREDV